MNNCPICGCPIDSNCRVCYDCYPFYQETPETPEMPETSILVPFELYVEVVRVCLN